MVKKLITGLAVATFLLATAGISDAATIWKTVTVLDAGVNGTSLVILATDTAVPPAFTNRNFTLNPATGGYMLGTALTALAGGRTIQIAVPSLTAGSVVSSIYVNN